MSFPQTYQTDGVQTVWSFDFPYLDRSHIFVTVNEASRAFTFVDDYTLKIVDLYGNPLAAGLPLKILRATPDLVEFAAFKDAANLTADDLNRARLQVLFLIQERSGGIAGTVGTVISTMANEIETISGALDQLSQIQGTLTAGLQTLGALTSRMTAVENGAQALQDQIDQEIANRDTANSQLVQRMDSLEVSTTNMSAQFNSSVNLLQSGQDALANKTDLLSAKIDNLEDETNDDDQEELAASIITSAVASVKADHSQGLKITSLADQITTLQANLDDGVSSAKSLVQVEQQARIDADAGLDGKLGTLDDSITAMAQQITTLQTQVGDNLAQVIQTMTTEIDQVNGHVSNLEAQYTLKVGVTRADGQQVMAGIGLAATASDDYVGSEILLMADKVLFVNPASTDGALVPIFEAGTVDGAASLVIPSTNVGDQTLPGRVLVDGSVEARSIAADTITGDKLVAGTISTDKLQVGLGVNLLKNSIFLTMDGWVFSSGAGGTQGNGLDPAGSTPLGGHGAYMYSQGAWSTTSPDTYNAQFISDAVPVSGSTYYEYSVYVGCPRCVADVGLQWLDSSSAVIGTAGFGSVTGARTVVSQAGGGTALSLFARIGGISAAPVNAAAARLFIRKGMNTTAEGDSSWLFFTQPMLAETTASATRLKPYNPSGQGTLITPAGISTPSLSALSATIGTLQSAASGQRTVLTDAGFSVFDTNNVERIFIGVRG